MTNPRPTTLPENGPGSLQYQADHTPVTRPASSTGTTAGAGLSRTPIGPSNPTTGPAADIQVNARETEVQLRFRQEPAEPEGPVGVPGNFMTYLAEVLHRLSRERAGRLEELAKDQEAIGTKRRALSDMLKRFNEDAAGGLSTQDIERYQTEAGERGVDQSVFTALSTELSQEPTKTLQFTSTDPNKEAALQKLLTNVKEAIDNARDNLGEEQEELSFTMRKEFNQYGTSLEQANQVQQIEKDLSDRISIA